MDAATPKCDRLAVIDLGSNSFRMVVFTRDGASWERRQELSAAVRIGQGLTASGRLSPQGMRRGVDAVERFADACRSCGLGPEQIQAVATSAIRDAENGSDFLRQVRERAGLDVRVLSREQEARYAYLAAVNSTALTDGCVLDLGGGSLQLVRVVGRLSRETDSWRLGAVRMTERFLPEPGPADPQALGALQAHVSRKLHRAQWLTNASAGNALVGMGGTVRSLAAAAQSAEGRTERVHGVTLTAAALEGLIERLAELPAGERASMPGIKAPRADIVLAGAIVIEGVMRAGGFEQLQVTGAGLREGIFFERQLDHRPLDGLLDWPRAA